MQIRTTHKRIVSLLFALTLLACFGCARVEKPAPSPSVTPLMIASDTPDPQTLTTPLPQPQLKYIFLFIGDEWDTRMYRRRKKRAKPADSRRSVFSTFRARRP